MPGASLLSGFHTAHAREVGTVSIWRIWESDEGGRV